LTAIAGRGAGARSGDASSGRVCWKVRRGRAEQYFVAVVQRAIINTPPVDFGSIGATEIIERKPSVGIEFQARVPLGELPIMFDD